MVMIDPFTHFTWIELISTKHQESVVNAFVKRILCEEGAPRYMLTDNGSEFKNKVLKDLMNTLAIDYQFAPAYHPQSNQAERANRFITETLRAVVRQPGAAARDWQKYVKFIEFGMRRLPIPGTNLTPFMAMRGRDPILPIDLPLAQGAPVVDKGVSEHVKDIIKTKTLAEKLLRSASEKVKKENKDLYDQGRTQITFKVGDLVRLWGVQRSSKGQASKLKLRNGVYKVMGSNGDLYDLQSVLFPEITRTNVHVSTIARWRGDAPANPHAAAAPAPQARRANQRRGGARRGHDDDDDDDDDDGQTTTQAHLWDQLKVNELAVFVKRDESPSYLRVAEVVELAADKRSGEFWYWVDCSPGKYNPAKPLADRRLTPEWADARGNTRVKPTLKERALWQPRQHSLSLEDIEIIVPAIKQHVGGKVVQKDYDKVNVWLRRRARTDSRASVALRALAAPNSLGDECATLMREDLLRARQHDTLPHVGHDEVSDTFLYRRVPMGGSLSTAEVLERNKEQPDRAGRIKELFSLWAPW